MKCQCVLWIFCPPFWIKFLPFIANMSSNEIFRTVSLVQKLKWKFKETKRWMFVECHSTECPEYNIFSTATTLMFLPDFPHIIKPNVCCKHEIYWSAGIDFDCVLLIFSPTIGLSVLKQNQSIHFIQWIAL